MQCQDKWAGHADCMTRIRQGVMPVSMMCEPCCKRYDMDYTTEPTAQQIRLSELYDEPVTDAERVAAEHEAILAGMDVAHSRIRTATGRPAQWTYDGKGGMGTLR